MNVEQRFDHERGCGWRQPGGLYLVADHPYQLCSKLPVPLAVCPTCHQGIHPSRGWTWVDGDALVAPITCLNDWPYGCTDCALNSRLGRVGLLWIGGKYYKTPADWTGEALAQGVSRRIARVPRDFVPGKTLVLVAHREVFRSTVDDTMMPGIFHAFRPTAVEYVVKGDEPEEKLDSLRKRGINPVEVVRITDDMAKPENWGFDSHGNI